MSSTPPGWYTDPRIPDVARYWDGEAWSASDAPAGSIPRPPAPTDYEQAAYTEPPPLAYNPVRSALRRTPGWVKAAVVIGSVVTGLGARWVFTLVSSAG
jgi:threonine dehydrogenase-like Zn-dependent dehydrogenase